MRGQVEWRRAAAFALGVAAAFLGGLLLYRTATPYVLRACDDPAAHPHYDDPESHLPYEMWEFEHRDRRVPSIVFTGASDVREAIDYKKAKSFFARHGLNYFNFGHNTNRNGIGEQAQILSALDLAEKDLVFFNVQPGYLTNFSAPRRSPPWETRKGLLLRARAAAAPVSRREYLELVKADMLPGYRYRIYYSKFFSVRAFKQHDLKAAKYKLNDKPISAGQFQAKINQYANKKLGQDQSIQASPQNLMLIRELKATYGPRLVFSQIPRNPNYSMILDRRYLAQHERAAEELRVVRFARLDAVGIKDYYDLDHLSPGGREKFTGKLLPFVLEVYRKRMRQ